MKKIFCIVLVLCFFSCKQPKVSFNIPPLVGKEIDAVHEILGGEDRDLKVPDKTDRNYSYTSYKSGGYLLSIEYNPQTRKVNYFQIVSDHMGFREFEDMLKIGNLDSTSATYSVETDRSFNFLGKYSNVTVYPK